MNEDTTSSSAATHDHHDHHDFHLVDPSLLVAPRWKKVLGDLWGNKLRTTLVVLSIFVGVFAVGMIAGSQAILSRELHANYTATRPAHATISTGGSIGYNEDFTINSISSNQQGFTEDLVEVVRDMDGVAEAEGRRVSNARVRIGQTWKSIQFTAIEDYDDMRVNQIDLEKGTWPPPDKHVLIERSGMAELHALNIDVGDTILVELPDGKERELQIAGVAHDLSEWPTPFIGTYYAYVSFDTMEWLGEPREYNEMLIRVEDGDNLGKAYNEIVAERVYDKIEKSGREPSFPKVATPGEHPLNFLIVAITSLMGLMGVFAILLSGFLVTNTISALLAQQIRHIGMMKAVGARPRQIMIIYMTLVACFGVIALVLAVPLVQVASGVFAQFLGDFFNFTIANTTVPPMVIALQVVISLAVPIVAALIPVYSGSRITVREALDSQGVPNRYGTGLLDHMVQRVRGLPRPVLLSLRNTFRRKGRIVLTLITLTLGGTFFISVFSIKDSLWLTIDEMVESLYSYDVEVYLDRTYRAENLVQEAERLPGVVSAEVSVQTTIRRVFPDGSEGEGMQLFAVPPDTETMEPQILRGRWLLPGDENALVVSSGVLNNDPDLDVGSSVVIKIKDDETTWHVVGVMKALGDFRWAYASHAYYSRVAGEVGQASYVRVVTDQHTPAYQQAMATRLEHHYQRRSIDVSSTKTMTELSEGDRRSIQVMTVSLLFMAVLVALVGGLGLAGTMSLNVIERTREIGIMRAIGASNGAIIQVFLVEGTLIGMISWGLGALLSLPVGLGMSYALGEMLFSSPLSYTFSVEGIALWFGFALELSAIASFWPAWKATRVTVRDVLAYE